MENDTESKIKELCNIKEQKTEYYLEEEDELADFFVDQTVIINKKYVGFAKHQRREVHRDDSENLDEWYPFANSFYNFTEDVDPLERVNHLLASKPSFVSCKSSSIENVTIPDEFPYSEKAAQIRYLESNPVSFIILGKPEIGERELGRELANYWHCVYIEPETLIDEEIRSGSRAGQCIEYNLRCGRAIGVDVLLRLVEKRINSESAKHRGFVICGLPLIPNDLYEEDPVSTESAIFTAKEIFDEVFDTTIRIGVPPSKPQVSFSSKYQSEDELEGEGGGVFGQMARETDNVAEEGTAQSGEENKTAILTPVTEKNFEIPIDVGSDYGICYSGDIGTNYEDQLNFLFGLLKQPFLIIYIACGTADVINKRNSYRYSVFSQLEINLHNEEYKKYLHERWSSQNFFPETLPEDFVNIDLVRIDPLDMIHLVQAPRHFPANVAVQLDHYHYTCLNYIERYVLMNDPQYFVKVDGRTPVSVMLQIVKSKITSLPVQPVILPVNLNIAEPQLSGEGAATENPKPELSLEEAIRLFRTRDVVNNVFKWTLSDWGTLCPVALANGSRKNGVPDYAVHFMNKMFFLSDEAAFLKFYRNPRPFLKPPNPKAPCKIFIYGPKCSGKTAIATCLGYILQGTVLSPLKLLQHMLIEKEKENRDMVYQTAIAEAMAILNAERAKEAAAAEELRLQQIRNWFQHVISLIHELVELLTEQAKGMTVTSLEISAFPMAMKKVSHAEIENETALAIREKKTELEHIGIPYESESLEHMAQDKKFLLNYLPQELRQKIEPKAATPFDDFVVAYANKALENTVFDLNITTENLIDICISTIREAEDNHVEKGHYRGGWIIDGMICDPRVLESLYPELFAEEIILLYDSSENQSYLTDVFKNRQYWECRNYRQFLMDLGKIDEAWRVPSVMSTDSYQDQLARDILSEILDRDVIYKDKEPSYRVPNYENEVRHFYDDWNQALDFFTSKGFEVIEIDVANKSVEQLMKSAIDTIEDRYRRKAALYTEKDRAEEVANLALFGNVGAQEEEGLGEGGAQQPSVDPVVLLEQNRRYGDTFSFCPVCLHDNWVYWKGKEEYAVKFEDRVYLLSTEEAMNKFLLSPRTYVSGKMRTSLPPPRICITGVPGCGKTQLTQRLADNFGLSYSNFEDMLIEKFRVGTVPHSVRLLRSEGTDVETHLSGYLYGDELLPDDIAEKLRTIWFKSPVRELGFVLCNFPIRISDISLMIKNKLIPDVIIQFVPNMLEIKDFLLNQYLAKHQEEIDKRRIIFEEENKSLIEQRNQMRTIRFQQMLDERRENRYTEKRKDKTSTVSEEIDTDRSQISFNSVEDLQDMDEINRLLDIEFPDIFAEQNTAENLEELKEKLEVELQETLRLESGIFDAMKIESEKKNIPFYNIPIELDFPNKTFRHTTFITANYKFADPSLLERCYEVSLDVADRLLFCGYFFLSPFGRTCPVQVYENKNPFQMYSSSPIDSNFQIFPLIHRSYIYFLAGRENANKFKQEVLKYVDVRNIDFPLIPFKVGIMGPPKCGKTVLAKRIQQEYGLHLVTRGQAARYVLEYLPLSDLAINMEEILRNGWELTDEIVMKCVEAACFNSRTVTKGAIFDGFPNNILEVKHLSYLGLIPHLVIDLEGTPEELFACCSRAPGGRGFRRYDKYFYEHLMDCWKENAESFRKWFDREYQVFRTISISTSNWCVFSQTNNLIKAAYFERKHYYNNIVKDWPLRLAYMLVTPLEFLERQSSYKTFCPCCLHFDNILQSGGDPPDRTGLVQFRNKYYWLCEDHVNIFLSSPESYLPPYNNHQLPQELPVILSLTSRPENVAHGGVCLVCYKQKRAFLDGLLDFAVCYFDQVFLFDSRDCMIEFLKRPHLFICDSLFRPTYTYPSLDYKELPILGMLEQYVSLPVIQALGVITRRRPVIPGLSASVSAAIGIGLHLKVFHSKISHEYKQYYVEADKIFHDRRLKIIEYLKRTKSIINPFLFYEEPYPKFQYLESEVTESSESTQTIATKIMDEILDNIDYV